MFKRCGNLFYELFDLCAFSLLINGTINIFFFVIIWEVSAYGCVFFMGGGGVLLHKVFVHSLIGFYFWYSTGWSGIAQQSSGMGRQAGRPVSGLSDSASLPSTPPLQTGSELAPAWVCVSGLITRTGSAEPPWPESIPSPSLCNPFIWEKDRRRTRVRDRDREGEREAAGLNLHCPASVVCVMQSALQV